MAMTKYFITTPIYYINDRPHIGHAYATIAADMLARWHRMQGEEVLFTTGTDENSQKTVEAAEAVKQDPRAYTDEMSITWQKTWDEMGISYNQFVRTGQPNHQKAVYELIKRCEDSGDIFTGDYEGLYCVGCEEFKRESELVDGKCPLHNRVPEKRKEKNYFFKLSKYQKPLLDHISKHPEFIQPESRRNEMVAFIERGLEDISISRQHGKWGIDWPDDKEQKIYVWFDALVNYLTVTGFPSESSGQWWPADVHIVGKDIAKFHAIYWPAMLLSAKIPLPKTVFAHGFFTIEGKKIGKSLGNAIDPIQLAGDYGIDALRYFLLREIPFGSDGEFNHERFQQVYNADLANELGNAVQRVAAMVSKYLGGTIGEVPVASHDTGSIRRAIDQFRLDKALEEIWVHVKGVNQYIEDEKPWELAKSDKEQLVKVLQQATSDLLHVARLIMPFVPATAERIIKTFEGGRIDASVGILFPKFEESAKKAS
jgi:methionyl-tRNA synthetase